MIKFGGERDGKGGPNREKGTGNTFSLHAKGTREAGQTYKKGRGAPSDDIFHKGGCAFTGLTRKRKNPMQKQTIRLRPYKGVFSRKERKRKGPKSIRETKTLRAGIESTGGGQNARGRLIQRKGIRTVGDLRGRGLKELGKRKWDQLRRQGKET